MDNEKFQELVLQQFQVLTEGLNKLTDGQQRLEGRIINLEDGQKRLEGRIINLEDGQQDIKKQLKFIWEDIKRLDDRLSKQEEETAYLKRLK